MARAWIVLVRGECKNSVGYAEADRVGDVAQRADYLANRACSCSFSGCSSVRRAVKSARGFCRVLVGLHEVMSARARAASICLGAEKVMDDDVRRTLSPAYWVAWSWILRPQRQ